MGSKERPRPMQNEEEKPEMKARDGSGPADDAKCHAIAEIDGQGNAGDYRRWLGMQLLFLRSSLLVVP